MATPNDIAASLTMDDIPVKLRCATCNKLAHNAFRMPCCDQSICEDCQASLPEACPVCFHEPVKADDCRPNKALRTTIKVFLRKKVVEREAVEKKRLAAEKAAAPPATPITEEASARQPSQAMETPAPDVSISATAEAQSVPRDISQAPQTPNVSTKVPESSTPTEAQRDIPQKSIESPGPEMVRRASTQTAGEGSVNQDRGIDGEKQSEQQQHGMGQAQQWTVNNGFDQSVNNGTFGFDGAVGGFPNMGMHGMGDFSQMMPMAPNGMPNAMMGSFPNMMGMPGMGMDPITMSQMYNGFGGQGMGMNSMNMGMGFDAGQGAFGGFNGQHAAWNAGQNKFNQNAYGNQANVGGIGGDFGANTGYGGYNMPSHQGNYNQMHQHPYPNNDFHQGHHGQGFQYRGRGRGRGYFNAGRGRGGYGQYNQYNQAQGNQANSEAFNQQIPEITRRGSPSYGPQEDRPVPQSDNDGQEDAKAVDSTNDPTAEEQLNKELDPGDTDDNAEVLRDVTQNEDSKDEAVAKEPVADFPETKTVDHAETNADPEKEDEKPAPIPSFISDDFLKPDEFLPESNTTMSSAMPPPPSNLVIPTGPAAYNTDQSMDSSPRGRGTGRPYSRGVDYRAGSHGRGSGYFPNGSINIIQPTAPISKPVGPPVAPKGLGVEGAPKAPKALRDGQPNTGLRGFSIVGRASAAAQARPNGTTATKSPTRERSRSRSRSPNRHQSSHHRRRRHRSASRSSSPERERRRDRHRHSRRHEDEEDDDYHDQKGSRARDLSADSTSKRSSYRSRRHHDEDKDKYEERSSHRSHRSQRDRSKDRDREDRTDRKKDKSPELMINGASRRNSAKTEVTSSRHKDRQEESTPTSRKRRSEDEDDYREKKRKRRGQDDDQDDRENERSAEKPNGHRSSRPSKRDTSTKDPQPQNHDISIPSSQEKSLPKEIPKGPKSDSTTMLSEREKYAAERIARENQRRMSQMGSGGNGSGGGGGGKLGRRVSHHKYEDEETVSKGESEREALRYR